MIIYGKNPVLEALKANQPINKILIAEGLHWDNRINEIINSAREKNIVFQKIPRRKLDQLSVHANNQGVIAILSPKKYIEVEDILDFAKSKKQNPLILILDQIEDPQNLGAIIRTAESAGVHGVVIPKHHASPINETVVKTSAGAAEHINISVVTNIAYTIDYLKENEIKIIGLDGEVKDSYLTQKYDTPLAIVLGNEGKGLRRLTKEKCDLLVKIPMLGKTSSLNVSASAAIVLYEVLRQKNNFYGYAQP